MFNRYGDFQQRVFGHARGVPEDRHAPSGRQFDQACIHLVDRLAGQLNVLAQEIMRVYGGKDLTLVAVLTGSVMFIADLLRRLPIQLRLDYVGVSSYGDSTRSSGDLVLTKSLKLDVRDRHVLVVDDILDSGQTMAKVRDMIARLGPCDLKFCVFIEKEIPHHNGFTADFIGFRLPDKFVVGYGLDYDDYYRNLPDLVTLTTARTPPARRMASRSVTVPRMS